MTGLTPVVNLAIVENRLLGPPFSECKNEKAGEIFLLKINYTFNKQIILSQKSITPLMNAFFKSFSIKSLKFATATHFTSKVRLEKISAFINIYIATLYEAQPIFRRNQCYILQ